MKVKFVLDHQVQFGQTVHVCGSVSVLGSSNIEKSIPMTCVEASCWELELDLKNVNEFEYFYLIKNNESYLKEWGGARKIEVGELGYLVVNDQWKKEPCQKFLYTSAFTNSFFSHNKLSKTSELCENTFHIKVNCPYVENHQSLILIGETNFLGEWDAEKALPMSYEGEGQWSISFPISKIKRPTQFKLAILDTKNHVISHWEERHNRIFYPHRNRTKEKELYILSLEYDYKWINWKAAGVAIPVFSIRTEQSAGVGDFADIKILADWAFATGQKVIQILPINDTTITRSWTDSYPYNTVSVHALHPQYFALSTYKLQNKKLQQKFSKEADHLNSLSEIDYEQVIRLKEAFIQALYSEIGEETLKSSGFKVFFKANEYWLFAYACFSILRDKYKTADYTKWKKYSKYNKEKLEQLINNKQKVRDELYRHYFTQYLLHLQLSDAVTYVRSKGMILKGDIPIGISHYSVEAWMEPHLFNLDVQTGAPPDDFAVNGQNWGFPTYNWEAMGDENFRWWKNRFQKMADYFDAYRIDHILGFFRIWEIPKHSVQGLLGYFSPALPYSVSEIQAAGLFFDENRLTQPFIRECYVDRIFGEYKDEVKKVYLKTIRKNRYALKKAYSSQKKIQVVFENKEDEKSICVRNGLYALCNEVLFIQDKYVSNTYHPRISAQHTDSYTYLSEADKKAFDILYNDFFYSRHNDFWASHAMQKLPPLINSTNMLVCGEDLGMIPACVPTVMNKLQILSLEIQRMPKEINTLFSSLTRLPYLSVCTTSTHDMSPIRAWWTENRAHTQDYYNEILWKHGEAPVECTPEVSQMILRQHLYSPAMLTIIPIQDWLALSEELRHSIPEEERINIPADSQHYWRYRMHLCVEQLIENNKFNKSIRDLLIETWRYK